jgi:hypothetical protein
MVVCVLLNSYAETHPEQARVGRVGILGMLAIRRCRPLILRYYLVPVRACPA